MLEQLKGVAEGIVAVKATGTVSKDDYLRVVEPLLDAARGEGRRIRFLYELGPEFEAFSAGGAWEDARVGLRFLSLFEGCAVVTDLEWVKQTTKVAGFLMPCPVRVFPTREREKAITWLASLPKEVGVAHRLIPEKGVIVIEVKGTTAQDFDAVAVTADAWTESHGELRGIVIHTRAFPGWENFGSFVRHLRFVRDHHRKVRRVALSADTELATLAPRIAEHFIKAEVKSVRIRGDGRGHRVGRRMSAMPRANLSVGASSDSSTGSG